LHIAKVAWIAKQAATKKVSGVLRRMSISDVLQWVETELHNIIIWLVFLNVHIYIYIYESLQGNCFVMLVNEWGYVRCSDSITEVLLNAGVRVLQLTLVRCPNSKDRVHRKPTVSERDSRSYVHT